MRRILILIVIALTSNIIFGQTYVQKSAQEFLDSRGEVYFKFTVSEEAELMSVTRIISVDKVVGNEVTAYANAEGFNKFLNYKMDYEVLTPPSMVDKSILENASSRNITEWDNYPTYGEYVNMMNQFAIDYPNLCEVVNIGATNNDRDLLFIHINDSLGVDQSEPEFMYTATMHGDEVTGYVLMLRLIDYLLDNYGSNPEITNLVKNTDIWINPLANPDGTYAEGNGSVWGATRFNANNVDLNRNYADPEDGPHPDGNEYQIETVAFMDFAEEHNFVLSSNLHGGAEVVNYPWDTWAQLAADDDWWIFVSREYADTVHNHAPSGYLSDFDNGITNGYAWYSISGGRQDYMNYFHNCREMTLEISNNKMPPESQLPDFWDYNYRSFINYMKQASYGFSGNVTNAVNGNPLEAEVFIVSHDIDNSWVYSQLPLGNYHRMLKEGTYDVKFSAFGCYDKIISDVQITDYNTTELNVELVPYGTLSADFTASTTLTGTDYYMDFSDNSVGNDLISWIWTFEGGNPETSFEQNPDSITYENSGDYDVTLTVSNMNGESDTKHMEDYITVKESFVMSNETVTNCDALFFDAGGQNAEYQNGEDYIMTFIPEYPDNVIKMEFVEFNIENHIICDNDYVEIFDGLNINATNLGRWCGNNSPGTILAGNEDGALTVLFHSNNAVVKPGWKALISCDSNVGVNQIEKIEIVIFPNPVSSKLSIQSKSGINNIIICDMQGRLLYSVAFADRNHQIDVSEMESGIYLLSFRQNGELITRKIIVN